MKDFSSNSASILWDHGMMWRRQGLDEKEALESRVTILCHAIEKGASLPSPRRPYGLRKLEEIDQLLGIARASGIELEAEAHARDVADALRRFNRCGESEEWLAPHLEGDLPAYSDADVHRFVSTRHSIRTFDRSRIVDPSLVRRVVELASSTPSVCNRHPYRAHYFHDEGRVSAILELQSGSSGFDGSVPGLIVVSVRRSSFVNAVERNQRWVDGGLFAMSIVWLFHAFGVGTCFLNWSQTNSASASLRRIADIPDSEDVVVLIAIGYPLGNARATCSPKRSLSSTFVVH